MVRVNYLQRAVYQDPYTNELLIIANYPIFNQGRLHLPNQNNSIDNRPAQSLPGRRIPVADTPHTRNISATPLSLYPHSDISYTPKSFASRNDNETDDPIRISTYNEFKDDTGLSCRNENRSNRGDGRSRFSAATGGDTSPRDELFRSLSEAEFVIRDTAGSGDCLFEALADQVQEPGWSRSRHVELRQRIANHIFAHPSLYQDIVVMSADTTSEAPTEEESEAIFNNYVDRISRLEKSWCTYLIPKVTNWVI
ncbi:hypothetical protein SeMB42_g00755 [Synchytrium endobioticum]|uniref:OTU domain-containing protein n=1 Tax=Synchytrium endobioticum TaxID=286115 RepID=A0A507DRI2_9FUNG|nr:hypothetical protein SeMB42_g00755 [Synchytrium endobioticum]